MSKREIEAEQPLVARQSGRSVAPAYLYMLLAASLLPVLLAMWPAYIVLPLLGLVLVVVFLVGKGSGRVTPASLAATILVGLLVWSFVSLRYARMLSDQGSDQANLWYLVAVGLFATFLLGTFVVAAIYRRTRKAQATKVRDNVGESHQE